MCPKKVLQGVPNLKSPTALTRLNPLVITKADSQPVRYRLLGHPCGPAGLL